MGEGRGGEGRGGEGPPHPFSVLTVLSLAQAGWARESSCSWRNFVPGVAPWEVGVGECLCWGGGGARGCPCPGWWGCRGTGRRQRLVPVFLGSGRGRPPTGTSPRVWGGGQGARVHAGGPSTGWAEGHRRAGSTGSRMGRREGRHLGFTVSSHHACLPPSQPQDREQRTRSNGCSNNLSR